MFEPMPVRQAREQVESQLREAILSGYFESGSKLPSEAKLAETFSASRTTVREALQALASDGLINKSKGASGGSFVQVVDHRSMSNALGHSMQNTLRFGNISYGEVAQTRQLLEVPSAGLAAKHRSDEDLAALNRVLDRQKEITVEDPEVPQLDMDFHTLVANASQNRVLSSFVSALHRAIRPVLLVDLTTEAGKETVSQHAAVVRAIAAQDSQEAEEAMGAHLKYLERLRDLGAEARAEADGG